MTTLLAFVFTLAVLIVFHEFGHYLVARRSGVKVLRFSVGFGPVIAQRTDRHGTEWVLSALPLGGYVKMLDEREGEVPPEQLDQTFNRKKLGARAAIVAAGPIANFVLAIILFWVLYMVGVPTAKPIIGTPPPHTPAFLAGMQAGETVVAVNGEHPGDWQDLHWLVLKHALRQAPLVLETTEINGHYAYRRLNHHLDAESLERSPLAALGLVHYLPPIPPVLGELLENGAAARAGLHVGDRVVSVNGGAIAHWDDWVSYIKASPNKHLTLEIARAGQTLTMKVRPEPIENNGVTIGRIGASPKIDPAVFASLMEEVRYAPWPALQRALQRTWELSAFSLEMLGRMVSGQASLKNLSGPLTIADYAGQSAQSGWTSFIAFLALVSISLGVLNLLPVPLLDGGHLLYYFAELLTGRPVPERVQEFGLKIGMGLLAALMFLAIYNDLQRFLAG